MRSAAHDLAPTVAPSPRSGTASARTMRPVTSTAGRRSPRARTLGREGGGGSLGRGVGRVVLRPHRPHRPDRRNPWLLRQLPAGDRVGRDLHLPGGGGVSVTRGASDADGAPDPGRSGRAVPVSDRGSERLTGAAGSGRAPCAERPVGIPSGSGAPCGWPRLVPATARPRACRPGGAPVGPGCGLRCRHGRGLPHRARTNGRGHLEHRPLADTGGHGALRRRGRAAVAAGVRGRWSGTGISAGCAAATAGWYGVVSVQRPRSRLVGSVTGGDSPSSRGPSLSSSRPPPAGPTTVESGPDSSPSRSQPSVSQQGRATGPVLRTGSFWVKSARKALH